MKDKIETILIYISIAVLVIGFALPILGLGLAVIFIWIKTLWGILLSTVGINILLIK